MRRKLLVPGLAYFVGMFMCAEGLGKAAVVIAAAAAVPLIFVRDRRSKAAALFSAFMLAAVGVFALYTHFCYDRVVALDGRTVTVSGKITDLSDMGSDKCRVTVDGDCGEVSAKVSFFCEDRGFDYGDHITAKVKVSKITDSINYLGETYQKPKGVFLEGEEAESVSFDKDSYDPILRAVMHFRDRTFSYVTQIIGGEEGAFVAAMLCGDKTELSPDIKSSVYRSGLGHILCVSGTHVILVGTMIISFAGSVIRRKRLRIAVSLVCIWLFALMAGMSAPVVRACIMMTALMSAELFHRKIDSANMLCGCMLVMLTLSPYAAGSASFLLSFSAAFSVTVFAPMLTKGLKLSGILGAVSGSALTSLTILIVSMPFQLIFFDEISVIAPITNIIAVPLCVTVLGLAAVSVIGIPFIITPILVIARYIIRIVLAIAGLAASFDLSYIPAGSVPSVIAIIISLFALFVFVLITRSSKKAIAASLCAMLVWVGVSCLCLLSGDDSYRLLILPDGNNMSCVLYKGSEGIIFDLGSCGKLDSALSRFESRTGVRHISACFVTEKASRTAEKMMTDLSYKPDKFFANTPCLSERSEVIGANESVQTGDIKVFMSNGAVLIDIGGERIGLFKGFAEINGTQILTDEEQSPMLIDIENETVRRVDYAFNGCG